MSICLVVLAASRLAPCPSIGIICDPASQPPPLPSIRPPPSEMRARCCLPDRHRHPTATHPECLCRPRTGSAAPTPWDALRRRPLPNLVGIQVSVNAERFQAVRGPLVLLSASGSNSNSRGPLSHPLTSWALCSRPPSAAHCRLITAFMRHGSTSDDSSPGYAAASAPASPVQQAAGCFQSSRTWTTEGQFDLCPSNTILNESQASIFWDPEDATVHHLSSIMHGSPAADPARGAGAQVCLPVAGSRITASATAALPAQQRALAWTCRPLVCPSLVPFVPCMDTRRQSAIRLLSLWACRHDGGCLGSDVTQTLHKRANRSTRHASWHQREIVPVRYVMVWYGVGAYAMHTSCSVPPFLAPPPITCGPALPSPPPLSPIRAAYRVPSTTERLTLSTRPWARVRAAPPTPYHNRPSP